ncbi:MAG: adenylate kinase [Anaerolinea sp.]|nr:adenylate kinase [Anaerolinea sp.]
MTDFPYHRIVVVGATGCGKSALAEKLAQKLGLDFIELDALYWKPDWVNSSEEEFRARVEAATRAPGWALAGNYGVTRDIIWPRAEAVVWLDYPFLLIFGRLWARTWRRWWTKELLWGTNYERLLPQFKLWSKDSLINWLFQTYWRRKRQLPQLFASPEYSHLKVFHFEQPKETKSWFNSL